MARMPDEPKPLEGWTVPTSVPLKDRPGGTVIGTAHLSLDGDGNVVASIDVPRHGEVLPHLFWADPLIPGRCFSCQAAAGDAIHADADGAMAVPFDQDRDRGDPGYVERLHRIVQGVPVSDPTPVPSPSWPEQVESYLADLPENRLERALFERLPVPLEGSTRNPDGSWTHPGTGEPMVEAESLEGLDATMTVIPGGLAGAGSASMAGWPSKVDPPESVTVSYDVDDPGPGFLQLGCPECGSTVRQVPAGSGPLLCGNGHETGRIDRFTLVDPLVDPTEDVSPPVTPRGGISFIESDDPADT